MFMLLNEESIILHITQTINYQDNGNVLVDNDTLAYAASLVHEVIEIKNIPSNIEPYRYCYKDGEFTLNKKWIEPTESLDIDINRIFEIMEGVIE